MRFDFDSETRRRLGYRLIDQIDSFFTSLPDRAVQLPLEQRSYGPLHDALPEQGADAEQVLDELCLEMVEKGFHVPSANYFGLMNPTPTYMGVLAEALVAGLNPQLATLARSQLASKIELETMRWIGERVGWPGTFNGTFTSGGNEANFSGLALALAAALGAFIGTVVMLRQIHECASAYVGSRQFYPHFGIDWPAFLGACWFSIIIWPIVGAGVGATVAAGFARDHDVPVCMPARNSRNLLRRDQQAFR